MFDFRPEDDNSKTGLLLVVLSLIFMNGEIMQDSKLRYFNIIFFCIKYLPCLTFTADSTIKIGDVA